MTPLEPMSAGDLPLSYINTATQLLGDLASPQLASTSLIIPEIFLTADPSLLSQRERWKHWAITLPADIPILITGETGTGKEVVAEVLRRPGLPFIPINCAAIPPTLIASILFGHVKGAFTGAIDHHQGAFLAAGVGTIFLDEIGDMPLDLQPYLLRAIENRRVTPVGSNELKRIDCRIIAATNSPQQLRSDLRARLSAITIDLPPLHQRSPHDWQLLGEKFNLTATEVLLVQEHYMKNIREIVNPADETSVMFPTTNIRYLRACGQRKLAYGNDWLNHLPNPLA